MKQKLFCLFFIIISIVSFSKEKKNLNIAIIYDDFVQNKDISYSLMEKEINNLIGDKYNVVFPVEKQITVNSMDKNEISQKMDALLNDSSVDIVIAGGLLSSYVALEKTNLSKPVFAPLIINPSKELITKNKTSGRKNLNYIVSSLDLKSEILSFEKIVKFEKLNLLIGNEMEKILNQMPNFKVEGIDINFIKMNNDNIYEVLNKIDKSEVIALGPINELSDKNQKILLNRINNNKIPSFSIFSLENENFDTLAQFNFEKEYKKRIRATAVNISQYLDGKALADLPVYIESTEPELILNVNTIKKIELWPDWNILAEAKLINFIPDYSENSMGLKELISIALNNSPRRSVIKKELELTNLNIEKAKSKYKPRVEASATALIIDEDRAKSIFTPAEQTLTAGVTLNQVIFSEDLNMSLDILNKQKGIKEEELKKLELDLILEVSEAYISILKVETYAKMQKNNLDLTKMNLEIAKERKNAGISGMTDIYRLESELSQNISSFVETILNIELAKTNLKRIINYDLNVPLEISNIDFNNKDYLTSNKELLDFITNQNNSNILVEFMHDLAIKKSSDLKNIDYGINIQERLIKNTKNKKFMPTVALKADYSINNIIVEGAGSSFPDYKSIIGSISNKTQKDLSSIVGAFGNPDEFNWSVGIGFRLPIYSGGELKLDKKISENEIETLELKRNTVEKLLEQQIRANISKITSEYSKIKNAEVSLNSATKALNIVKDSYSKGITSIFDLISVQNSAFSAEQYKVTSTYNLIIEVMRAERTIGDFYILKDNYEKEKFVEAINLLNKNR